MTSKIRGNIFKFYLTFILILPCIISLAQVDLKNSLPDLTFKYTKASKDTVKIRLALAISNFYLQNKASTPANIDSAFKYTNIAENQSSKIAYKKGIDDAQVIKVGLLLVQNKTAEARNLAAKATGTLYCRLNIAIGKFFLEKGGQDKADLDISNACLTAAQKYSEVHHMPILSLTNLICRYPLSMEQNLAPKVYEKNFSDIIEACKKYNQKGIEAQAWYIRGAYAATDSTTLTCYRKAASIAQIAHDTNLTIKTIKDIADLKFRHNKLDTAETQLKNVLKMYTAAGYKNLQYTYDLLAAVYMAKGNLEAAMRCGLNAVRCADSTGTDFNINYIQFRLANLCRDMGLRKESIKWNQKCLDNTIKIDKVFPYLVFRELSADMIKNGQANQVLEKLSYALKKYPPSDPQRSVFIPMIQGDCYMALNKPALAEKFYLQAIALFKRLQMQDSYYYLCCKNIADFYVGQKLYNKAAPYLQEVFANPNPMFSVANLAAAHQIQFKIDSANGRYLLAIKQFEASKAITDSVFNHVRLKQSEQLQVQFETAQRDRENLLLRNKNNLQRSELEKETLNRKLSIIALLGSVLVIGLMLYLYRAKQKSNTMLKLGKNEINQQNNQLNQLLREKEWFMKEIHHRVKNNLQIISSLLNTQSSYLDNEQAVIAIRDSQNRMQAISIVHQKLYQSEDLSTINLQKYIEELARSIQDSFHDRRNVKFIFLIEDIYLTTVDTVPLGLILNEALTNSVKYAFNDNQRGAITISMTETTDGRYRLIIRDNGKGLPDNFDVEHCTSLGINLMIGLTEQLSGKFDIHSDNGTVITVIFQPSSSELGLT